MSDQIAFASATVLAGMIRDRKIGSLELLEHYLGRIERINPQVNAVISFQIETARERAKAADAATMAGKSSGPLHGVPMTVKESFDVAGLPTTQGFTHFTSNIAATDALSVQRLQAAGAIVFGKTNVPVSLADWQSFNPVYGTTNNPWNLERTPGGSSGGSAAALAAGLTGLEIGSDIGASIRDPSHYCGVYGHKSTFGVCSRDGHSLPGMAMPDGDISVIGPLARSAHDLETALDLIAGPDAIDGRGWSVSLPRPTKTKLSDFRVAVMPTADTAPVDSAVRHRIEALADFLRRSGAQVDDEARPVDPAEAHEVFVMLLRAATSRGTNDETFERYVAERASMDGRSDYYAWLVRAVSMSHREWLHWHNRRNHIRLAWERFFGDYDLLLCPTAATTAFPHMQTGERWERMISVDGQRQPTTMQLFWAGYSGMAYLPSTIAPIGLAPDGLPVGVQIIAPAYGDHTAIRFAQLLEREYYGFVAPPAYA